MYRRCISYFSSSLGLGVNDVKHGFTEAELAAVMAAFDTHPEDGKIVFCREDLRARQRLKSNGPFGMKQNDRLAGDGDVFRLVIANGDGNINSTLFA